MPSSRGSKKRSVEQVEELFERVRAMRRGGDLEGLLVEEITLNEDQNQISMLADQAEAAVEQNSLASGVEFTIGGVVYHDATGKLTPTSGTGDRMGVSQSAIFSNSGSDLVMLTDPANDNIS